MGEHLYMPWTAVPAGVALRTQPLSRRQFLGVMAAAPAATHMASAWAAEAANDSAYHLRFDLSEDGRELEIVRFNPGLTPPELKDKLKLSTEMFGSAAWFDLTEPGEEGKRHTLVIRKIAYGALTGCKIELRFVNDNGWRIGLLTDVWLNSDGKPLEYQTGCSLRLDSFIQGEGDIEQTLYASRITKTFERLFDGRIDAGKGKQAIAVGFTHEGQWRLNAAARRLTAFDAQVSMTDFRLGWFGNEEAGAAAPGYYLGGCGDLADISRLSAGAGSDLAFRLLSAKAFTKRGWSFEIRRAPAAVIPGAYQSVCRIAIGEGTAEFAKGGRRIAGPFDLRRMVVTETLVTLPGRQIVRTVVSAAGQADPAPGGTAGEAANKAAEAALTLIAREMKLETPIGLVRASSPLEPANGDAVAPERGSPSAVDFGKVVLAANGDRSGAPGQTVWIVADRPAVTGAHQKLRRAAVDLHLQEAFTALPDVSDSSLRFDSAELRLAHADGEPLAGLIAESPMAEAASYIWLGAAADKTRIATLDLSRATLTASRDYDQANLRFRFLDMVLAFSPQPRILPARDDGGVVVVPHRARDDMSAAEAGELPEPVRVDTRPVLVVEFDPQHVMEEAIFLPEPPPLPDVDLAEPIVAKPGQTEEKWRTDVQLEKQKAEGPSVDGPFTAFCLWFATAAKSTNLPNAQKIYIGPEGLAPDAFELARKVQAEHLAETIEKAVKTLLDTQAAEQLKALLKSEAKPGVAEAPAPTDRSLRLELERKLESTLPLYALFRSRYRELMSGALGFKSGDTKTEAVDVEFFHSANRNGLTPGQIEEAKEREKDARKDFVTFVSGKVPIPDIVEARLSGPSRLAFRVNARPGPGDGHDANGLAAGPSASSKSPGAAGVAFGGMPFTFAALTDWSHHEPAVTRRAEKLFRPTESGMIPPLGEIAADLDDRAMLCHQGISAGLHITGEQRMGEIRSSLQRHPTALETAIEIPSRLLLSTAQDAVWQATRRFAVPDAGTPFSEQTAMLEFGLAPTEKPGTVLHSARDLWTARLLVEDVAPGLRVVGTPDFRPMALRPASGGDGSQLPGHHAPPRGALAPWFLGPEQSESGSPSPRTVHKEAFRDGEPEWTDDAEFCEAAKGFKPERKLRLVDWLCQRLGLRTATDQAVLKFFRTSLDAYDRHELLLLSSAYGLPVTGKRLPVGDNVEVGGALVAGSGQFEPGAEFALVDGRNDEAIYRPVPLNATELTLSSLGGSFTHDTHFNPPATALDYRGKPFFSGLSIERWQHHIVLGRDIRAEVVYKGYLFPFGHRASLVKLTERVFLKTPNQGYKALLRQRIFLRVGKPNKKYPAVGQPNGGRQWCASEIDLLTRVTPDIVDPTTPVGDTSSEKFEEMPNGKLSLAGAPGLAFWPKLDLTEGGRFAFQFSLDGRPTALPLIFLDNVAATNPTSVKQVCDYYNGLGAGKPPVEGGRLRTIPLFGQKLRFAEENEAGDATFATESVLVRAQGRLRPGGSKWGGDSTLYETTGVLEGAEQPPFYPAVDKARIRIEQIERFTGADAGGTEVRYDGHYLDKGFNGRRGGPVQKAIATADGNPLEVFLDLIDPVRIRMGASGDRSGGIARPESSVVALSRSKGPLGSDTPGYVLTPGSSIVTPGSRAVESEIVSLAHYFADARSPDQSAHPASAPAAAPPTLPEPDVEKRREVFQSFFTGDAKLLGLISLKKLMTFFDLGKAEVPLLKEAIEFGAALEKTGTDAVTVVRTNVLLPMRQTVASIRQQWEALDARLIEQQASVGAATDGNAPRISIREFFPEIEQGLNSLAATIDVAIAEQDPLRLPKKLSAVYESGRAFARLLGVLVANAPERMLDAVRDQLLLGVGAIQGEVAKFAKVVEEMKSVADAAIEDVMERLVGELLGSVTLFEDLLPLPYPLPDLHAVARAIEDGDLDDAQAVATEAVAKLAGGVATGKAVLRHEAAKLLRELGEAKITPEVAALKLARALVDSALEPVDDAVELIEDDAPARCRQSMVEAVEAYRAGLIKLRASLPLDRLPGVDQVPELSELVAAVRRLREQADSVRAFLDAAKAGNLPRVLAAAAPIVRDAFDGEEVLSSILKEPVGVAADGFDKLARTLGFKSDAGGSWPSDDEAKLIGKDRPADLPDPSSDLVATVVAALNGVAELEETLQQAQSDFDDHVQDLKLDTRVRVEALLDRLKTWNDLAAQELWEIYGNVVRLGRGLAGARQSLEDASKASLGDGTDGTLRPAELIERLRAAGNVVEAAVKGLGGSLTRLVNALKSVAGDTEMKAVFAIAASAAGLEDSKEITDAINGVKAAVDQAEENAATALARIGGATLSLLSKGALLSAAGIDKISAAVGALSAIFDPERAALLDALVALKSTLPTSLAEDELSAATPASIDELLDLRARYEPLQTVREFFGGAGGKAQLDALLEALRNAERAAVADFHGLKARASGLPRELVGQLFQSVNPALLKPAFGKLAEIYGAIFEARNGILTNGKLAQFIKADLLEKALTVEPVAMSGEPRPEEDSDKPAWEVDRLAQEVGWLNAVATAATLDDGVGLRLRLFVEGWRDGSAAPLRIAGNVKDLVVDATSGEILSMIDVAALRDEIQDALANLVPVRSRLAYDLNLATGDNSGKGGQIFELEEGSRFDVSARLDIDLLGKTPASFRAGGRIGAFKVNLLGSKIFDAIRLEFHGASFVIENGGKPSFDVDYKDFVIGEKLKFAQQLQSFLTPSGGGFYLQPLDRMPGIEAGYGLNLGTIQLGGMSFSNVSLNVAALLPFTDSEAMFRASLARRLAPFTISVPPFGGSGYFAITANARSIIGFEASFEFGGSADFSFGPLVAYGRLMSGFYIRTLQLPGQERVTELSGTFFAGGAASIWIFNFYASLYVKLGMAAGGAMEGEAIFTFSFSMGIVDYDYSVRVARRQPQMGRSASLDSGTRFAGLLPPGVDPITTASIHDISQDDYGFVTGVAAATVCQGKDPLKYFDYFDLSLMETA